MGVPIAAAGLLFLSACAPAPAPSSQAPSSSVQQGTAGTASPEAPCTPVAGGIPKTIADFNCLSLVSVSGRNSNGPLAWLGTDPITVKTSTLGGQLNIGGQAACNYYGAPVTVTATMLIVSADKMTSTAIGCLGAKGEQDKWVFAFLGKPMNYTVRDQTLVLSNSLGEIILKPATMG